MAEGRPKYPLNTAAQLVGLSPRTLRGYEEAALIEPARIGGKQQRMYSEQDLQWLRCIRDMIHDEGLTVRAIRRLLDLIPCWEIRHCEAGQALACAPYQNVPEMAHGAPDTTDHEADEGQPGHRQTADSTRVTIKLIYGVQELGAVMHCSRCISAERVARRVAMQFPDCVCVTKHTLVSQEAARHGVLMPPAVIVDDEVVSSGKGVSADRLEAVVRRHLEQGPGPPA